MLTDSLSAQERAPAEQKTRRLVERFIELDEAGQFEDCYRMLNPDARYTIIGETAISGTYHGPDDVFERLAPLLVNFTARPQMKFSEVMIDGNRAFLRASSTGGEGKYGPYAQPHYGFYLRVDGEGFAELVEFLDPVQLEVSLFGKKLVDG
jgi:ketosteroid isomerase-like protein